MKTEKFSNRSMRSQIREDIYKINKEQLLSTINTSVNYVALPNRGVCRLALSEDD